MKQIPDSALSKLSIDHETGGITWNASRGPTDRVLKHGDGFTIRIDGEKYSLNRVRWALLTGEDPSPLRVFNVGEAAQPKRLSDMQLGLSSMTSQWSLLRQPGTPIPKLWGSL